MDKEPIVEKSQVFLKPSAVARLTGLSRTTLWRMSRTGDFPKPIPLSKGRVGYSADSVNAWVAEKLGA